MECCIGGVSIAKYNLWNGVACRLVSAFHFLIKRNTLPLFFLNNFIRNRRKADTLLTQIIFRRMDTHSLRLIPESGFSFCSALPLGHVWQTKRSESNRRLSALIVDRRMKTHSRIFLKIL